MSHESKGYKRFVLYSPEHGVFLGHCLGLGFWSKVDPVGQPWACIFSSKGEAVAFVSSWKDSSPFPLETREVMVADPAAGASITECVAAGLPGWII